MISRIPKSYIIIGGILLLCAIIFILLVAVSIFTPESSNKSPTSSQPTPTSYPVNQGSNPSTIKPDRIDLPNETAKQTTQNPSQGINYTFPEHVYPEAIRAEVDPEIPVTIKRGKLANEIIVAPKPPDFWKPDLPYTVTLKDKQGNTIAIYTIKVPRIRVIDAD